MGNLTKWSNEDYKAWRAKHAIKRSYESEVVSKIESLKSEFNISKYGELNYPEGNYPLYNLKSKIFSKEKPNILITGGVHGYETSGVQGALLFMKKYATKWEDQFNFICFPCISPWGYETINRWNPDALDPNRNFTKNSPAQECQNIYNELERMDLSFLAHFDLHETTDTDNTVFRPDLEKRDGVPQEVWDIPDGFYIVGDTSRREDDFQKAMIESVRSVTHIAPSDAHNKLIGEDIIAEGIINYDVKKLFLCAGLTNAPYVTTTEVYPDSPKVTDDECNKAQVMSVIGGLEYLAKTSL